MKQKHFLFCIAALFLLTACTNGKQIMEGDGMTQSYMQISQEEAQRRMALDDGHVVVDVRRQDEYDAGHIPGAVCIPNETIDTAQPEELPDLNQIILVYCRTGNRSKQAAQKLFDMGYRNVYEFGDILDWPGVVTGETGTEEAPKTATLSFDSFDGGGPEYSVAVDDPEIVSYDCVWQYAKEDHAELTGAGYTVVYTFTGLKPGETRLTVSARSPIAENFDLVYAVTADGALNVSLEELGEATAQTAPILGIQANDRLFYASFEDNSSAKALIEKLSAAELELQLHDYGDFEKVGSLPWELPRNDVSITTEPGDVILYQGDQITIYYGENTWSFTKLAHINGVTREELLDALGDGDVTVCLWVEWSE